jgi:hypothetical protein
MFSKLEVVEGSSAIRYRQQLNALQNIPNPAWPATKNIYLRVGNLLQSPFNNEEKKRNGI